MEVDDREIFVAGIKYLIKKNKDLSQRVIAEKAGISAAYVCQLLGKESRGPFSAYSKIARACGFSLAQVLEIGEAVYGGKEKQAESLLAKEVEQLKNAVQSLSETIEGLRANPPPADDSLQKTAAKKKTPK